ncbi:MAG: OmpL47-type beta-barrel domain-containing protein [Spirochaetota bacterium]
MKKRVIILCVCFLLASGINVLWGEQKRIYNDGIIDYAPPYSSIVLSADDFESTLEEIQYSLDGASLNTYAGPITLREEGRHVVVYRAVDRAGNVSSEKIYSVVVDATAPEGSVTVIGSSFNAGQQMYITSNSTIVLWAEDNLSGVDTIYVSLDEGPFIAYTGPVNIPDEGFHSAEAYAVDNVGNKTPVYELSGYVDNTPPQVSIAASREFVVVNGQKYTTSNNQYSLEYSDEIAGVRDVLVSLDGSDFVVYTGPFKVQTQGRHTIRAKAVDRLGNVSPESELSFFVDITPPEAKMGVSLD